MKKTLITTMLLALATAANAFIVDFTALTGNIGTQTITVSGYGSVTVTGLPTPGSPVSTSAFGLVLDPGESIRLTFTGAPVQTLTATTVGSPVTGPTVLVAGQDYLYSNNGTGGQTASFFQNVEFTTADAVPEPSTTLLGGLATLGLLARRRK